MSKFTPGQKVIAIDGKKEVETYFLAELEGVEPRYVCVSPQSRAAYEKDKNACTLKRYMEIKQPEPPVEFKIGQKIKYRDTRWYDKYAYSVITGIVIDGKRTRYAIAAGAELMCMGPDCEYKYTVNTCPAVVEIPTKEEVAKYFE